MKKVFLAMFVCLFLVLPLSLTFSSTAHAKDPIVFVHGFSGSTIVNFSAMIGWFKNDGYSSGDLFYYKYMSTKGVKSGAEYLKVKVNAALAETGADKVDLVCHSMGGLVARYYMKKLGGSSKVDKVVYVATPHKGTAWAYAALWCPAGWDMLPGSNILNTIDGYAPGLSLWSNCDEIVLPNSSAKVGETVIGIGCWEHIASTWSYNVYELTRDYID